MRVPTGNLDFILPPFGLSPGLAIPAPTLYPAARFGVLSYGLVLKNPFRGVIVAVVLRLARLGKHKAPAYRVVATEKQNKRDGKFLEVLGTYNPLTSPAQIVLKEDRIKKWLSLGAMPTSVVRSLIKRSFPGVIEGREDHKKKKIQEARRKRKERTAKSGGAKKPAAKAKAAK